MMESQKEYQLRLRVPSNMIVYGVTKSGKTQTVIEMIKRRHELFDKHIDKVIYLYAVDQPAYKTLKHDKNVVFSTDPSIIDQNTGEDISLLVVFDDFMLRTTKNPEDMTHFFTVYGHHNHLFIIYMVQNIFNEKTRILNNNVDYAVFMPFLRNSDSVLRYFRQVDSSNAKHLFKAYKESTQKPYSHFLMSFHQLDHEIRYRSSVFVSDCLKIFRPRNEDE